MNVGRVGPNACRTRQRHLQAAGASLASLLVLGVGAMAQGTPYYGWTAPPEFQELKNPITPTAESVSLGKRIFERRCVQCHGVKGDGEGESSESLRVPPGDLTDAKRMGTYTDGTLFWKIQVGRGEMPPWQLVLKEQEIWHVVNYVRGFTAKPQ